MASVFDTDAGKARIDAFKKKIADMKAKAILGEIGLEHKDTPNSDRWIGRDWGRGTPSPSAIPEKKERLSGDNGNLHGLMDVSGIYPSKSGRPIVMERDTFLRTEAAIAAMKADENFDKYYGDIVARSGKSKEDWRPTLNYAYRPTSEQQLLYDRFGADQAAKPGTSFHEAGVAMDFSIAGLSPEQYNLFDIKMKEQGFSKVMKDGKERANEKHHWENKTHFKSGSEAVAAVNKTGDPDIYSRTLDKKRSDITSAMNPKATKSRGVLTGKTGKGFNPSEAYYNPGNRVQLATTDRLKQENLDSVIANEDTAFMTVDRIMTEENEMNAVRDAVAARKAEGYKDKRDRNVVSGKPKFGYEEKLDVPAHIRIQADEVAVGANQDNLTENWAAFNVSDVEYIDCFILRSVKFVHEERYHIFQALNGETTSFFFGSKPVIYNFSGSLLDTYNQQWFNDFMYYYENYLRGTKVILNKTRIFVTYEDQIVEGYLLDTNISRSSEINCVADFSFNMIMVQKTRLNSYKDPIFRNTSESAVTNFQQERGNRAHEKIEMIQDLLDKVSEYKGYLINSGQAMWNSVSGRLLSPPTVNPLDLISDINVGLETNATLGILSLAAPEIRDLADRAISLPGSIISNATNVQNYADLLPKDQDSLRNKMQQTLGFSIPGL